MLQAMLRIRDVIPKPGSKFFHTGSEFFPSRIRIKEFKYFKPKIVTKLSEIWSRLFIPDPDPGFLPILDPGSRGKKGTGSQISDPDPKHILLQRFCCIRMYEKAQNLYSYTDIRKARPWHTWVRYPTVGDQLCE